MTAFGQLSDAARPGLVDWWSRTDPGVQALLEKIFAEAPGAVGKALTDGQWTPTSGTLAEHLASTGSAYEPSPMSIMAEDLTVTPFHAQIGQTVTVTWTDVASGNAEVEKYFDDIYVLAPSGAQVAAGRIKGDRMERNMTAKKTFAVNGIAEEGQHTVMLICNAEGVEHGGIAGPQGYRIQTATTFEAGDSAARADSQDDQMLGAAFDYLAAASLGVTVGPDNLINALSMLTAHRFFDGDPTVSALADELGQVDPARWAQAVELNPDLAMLSGAGSQAISGRDPAALKQALATLLTAIRSSPTLHPQEQ